MSGIEKVYPLKINIEEFYHFLKIQLFLLIELESLGRQLYTYGKFRAACSKDDFSVFVDNPTFDYDLTRLHHSVYLQRYLVKVQSLLEEYMSKRFSQSFEHFVMVSSRKVGFLC